MDNKLVRYTNGEVAVPYRDRSVAKRAKDVFDEVRLNALKADGAMALAGHIMEGVVELDNLRREISQGDPALEAMLMSFESTALRQMAKIQRELYDPWGA